VKALWFTGNLAGFTQAAADLRAALDRAGVQGRARYRAELIFEEVVTNVIRHGYQDNTRHTIGVDVTGGDRTIVLTFEDDGRPFDPLGQPARVQATSLDDPPIGGLGIAIVRKAAKDIRYTRTADGRNRLTVTIAAS
jgi:serine/threonine-protein kinase RsbW